MFGAQPQPQSDRTPAAAAATAAPPQKTALQILQSEIERRSMKYDKAMVIRMLKIQSYAVSFTAAGTDPDVLFGVYEGFLLAVRTATANHWADKYSFRIDGEWKEHSKIHCAIATNEMDKPIPYLIKQLDGSEEDRIVRLSLKLIEADKLHSNVSEFNHHHQLPCCFRTVCPHHNRSI